MYTGFPECTGTWETPPSLSYWKGPSQVEPPAASVRVLVFPVVALLPYYQQHPMSTRCIEIVVREHPTSHVLENRLGSLQRAWLPCPAHLTLEDICGQRNRRTCLVPRLRNHFLKYTSQFYPLTLGLSSALGLPRAGLGVVSGPQPRPTCIPQTGQPVTTPRTRGSTCLTATPTGTSVPSGD